MDTNNDEFYKLLAEYGIDPSELPSVNKDEILDIPRRSMERFAARTMDDIRKLDSYGYVRLHGEGITDHSVEMEAAGKVLLSIQKTVTNFGASLLGNKKLRGNLPLTITERLKLLLTASPLPGSIVFTISPEKPGFEDMYPEGPALFENEDGSLIDNAVKGVLDLLAKIDTSTPGASDEFVAKLFDLGPRFTSSLEELVGELSSKQLDTDIEWSEPGQKTVRATVPHESAKYARELISVYKADIEVMRITGIIRTLSDFRKLDLETDDGNTISIDRGLLKRDALTHFNLGQRVTMEVELYSGTKPGGKPVTKYRALSIDGLEEIEPLF